MRVTDLLRTIDLFEQLSSDELDELAHRMRDRHLKTAEVLCRQGDKVEAMFIVLTGCVELTAGAGAQPPSTRPLNPGDSLGEIPLISDEVHPATATALVESRVLVLDKDDFEALVATRPRLMRVMLAAVSRRAIQANRQLLTDQPDAAGGVSSGRIYPVFSPRGGAGKTTLAVALATRLAELLPQRVALLDLDLVFADAALQLGVTPGAALASIGPEELSKLDPRALSGYLVEHPSSLRVLVGTTSPEGGERVTVGHVRSALAALKRHFLVTIVDCSGTFSEPIMAVLEGSDRVLVVCTPELVTLRDVRDSQRIFQQALHLERRKLFYILNRPLPTPGLTRLQFETALEQPMSLEIAHAGESASKPTFARAIEQLARELLPTDVAMSDSAGLAVAGRAPSAKKGLLGRWRSHHER